jgi:hypothetical protein
MIISAGYRHFGDEYACHRQTGIECKWETKQKLKAKLCERVTSGWTAPWIIHLSHSLCYIAIYRALLTCPCCYIYYINVTYNPVHFEDDTKISSVTQSKKTSSLSWRHLLAAHLTSSSSFYIFFFYSFRSLTHLKRKKKHACINSPKILCIRMHHIIIYTRYRSYY